MLASWTCPFVNEIIAFDVPENVAVSEGPFGTVAGVQLAAVFQSPFVGLRFQVALPANEWAATKHEKRQTPGKSLFLPPMAAETGGRIKPICPE
jgi:hypothetical protein